jgi:hypothetical protein
MITIKTRPYDGITPKLNGVYNGLPFVLDSNNKQRPNFRYLCDIWANDAKISSLRHNPDISADNFGVFDVGPILETYLAYDQKALSPYSAIPADQTVKKYWVELGEEFARTNIIAGISNGGVGYTRIQTKFQHSLRQGDAVFIQGCSNAAYNGWKRLSTTLAVGANSFYIIGSYAGASDVNASWLSEGEIVTSWSSTTIAGQQYLTVQMTNKTIKPSRFNLGDTVQVNWHTYNTTYTDVPQNAYENTDWKIISVRKFNTNTPSAIVRYVLDCPWKGTVAFEGAMTSKDNYIFSNLISTKLESSYAWNGVLQYDQMNDWNPGIYKFTGTASKFLSSKPSKSVKVCSDEYYTLTSLGSQLNPASTLIIIDIFNAAGSLIASYSTPLSLYASVFPCGPKNLKDAGIPEFVNATAKSYKIYAKNGVNIVSETWSFSVECECTRLTAYKLMWLNKQGGFDYFKFPMRSDKSLAIEKSTYEKNLRYVQPTKYGYNMGDRGTTTYNINSRQTIIVRTNFLNQEELDWLNNIYESPEVYYIDDANSKIYPVTIMNTTVDQPNKKNRGDAGPLYIYEAELQLAHSRTTQNGGIGVPDRAAGSIASNGQNNAWF